MRVMGRRKAWCLGRGQEERPFFPQLSLGHLLLAPSSTIRKRSAIKALDQGGGCSRGQLPVAPASTFPLSVVTHLSWSWGWERVLPGKAPVVTT